MGGIKVPMTSAAATPSVVPDHFKLADALQFALLQLGDGFFPLSGTVTTGPLTGRTLKTLNGEVIPGSGLNVLVRDCLALLGGTLLTEGNKEQFNAESTISITVPAGATRYIIIRPTIAKGTDGADRPDMQKGLLTAEATVPVDGTGLIVATVVVPGGATQVTSGMISTAQKKYLVKISEVSGAPASSEALIGLREDTDINLAKIDFKIDALLQASTSALQKGFAEVFTDDSDIDTGASTAFRIQDSKVKVAAGAVPNLAAYYKFEEGSGTTVADSSGNGHTGTLVGSPTWVAGADGGAIQFNDLGVDQVTLGHVPALQENLVAAEYTISFMVNLASDGGGPYAEGILVSADPSSPGSTSDFYVHMDWRTWAGLDYMSFSGSAGGTSVGYPFGPDTWYHVAIVQHYSGGLPGLLELFVNGALVQTANFGAAYAAIPGSHTLVLGAGFPSNGNVGRLDEVAFFSRALTAVEVAGISASNGVVTLGSPATSFTVISKAHAALSAPGSAMLIADGSNDLQFAVSRDDGATWTTVTNGVLTSISGQPSGTAMRYKVTGPNSSSILDNVAMFWS